MADYAVRGQSPGISTIIDQLFQKADSRLLRSAISRQEGQFLEQLASRPDIRNTIEIGCANAISSLYICSGISAKDNPSHTAIDPFQTNHYRGRGIANVESAGFTFFHVIEQGSETALPGLLSKGKFYDLALIDGLHTADQTLVDFYYIDRLLKPGGVVVIDDVNATAVNKIVHYVSTYPNYRLIGTCGPRGVKRRILNIAKRILATALWPVRKAFGEALLREFFDISVVKPAHLWTIDFCTMAAFEKIAECARDTDWYEGI